MIYLYAGFYEWFLTDKRLPESYVLRGEFDSLGDALDKTRELRGRNLVHVQEGLLPWWDIDDEAIKPFTLHGITFIF